MKEIAVMVYLYHYMQCRFILENKANFSIACKEETYIEWEKHLFNTQAKLC